MFTEAPIITIGKDRVRKNLRNISANALALKTNIIVFQMRKNTLYFRDATEMIDRLEKENSKLKELISKSRNRDGQWVRARDAAKDRLSALVSEMGDYVQIVSKGSGLIIVASGFELRRGSIRRSTELKAPAIKAQNKGQGRVKLLWNVCPDALLYQLEYAKCEGNQHTDVQWQDGGTHFKASCTLSGLDVPFYYLFRVRAVNRHAQGEWSQSERIVVG